MGVLQLLFWFSGADAGLGFQVFEDEVASFFYSVLLSFEGLK